MREMNALQVEDCKSRKMTQPFVAAAFTAAAMSILVEYTFTSMGIDSLLFGNMMTGWAICLAAGGLVYWFFDWRICRQLRIEHDELRRSIAR